MRRAHLELARTTPEPCESATAVGDYCLERDHACASEQVLELSNVVVANYGHLHATLGQYEPDSLS